MRSAKKTRLDALLVTRQLATSCSKAAAMIMAREVSVDATIVDKPGALVRPDAIITLKQKPRYVSRGGLKLEAALSAFGVDPAGRFCADIGSSTGGFTDCLLQHGAAKVYAIDVGRGILDYRLRTDSRVVSMENTNARYLESLGEPVDLVVIDVSFISLRLILPAVSRLMDCHADIIALVKPQFEAAKSEVGQGGIVRDVAVHRRVLHDTAAAAESLGFAVPDVMRSPITGAKGNVEYLMWLNYSQAAPPRPPIHDKINALTSTDR